MKIYILNIKSRSIAFGTEDLTEHSYVSAWISEKLAYNALVEFMKTRYFTNSTAVHCLCEVGKYKEAIELLNVDYRFSKALKNETDYRYTTYSVEIKELDLKGSAYE